MARKQTRIGKVFGRLTVAERVAAGESHSSNSTYRCKCTCGGEKIVRWGNLAKGTTKSCGCLAKEVMDSLLSQAAANREAKARRAEARRNTPKVAAHPLYSTWRGMLKRCYNPRNQNYKFYGGRGISVCEEWRSNFWTFVEDLGPKPDPSFTLDRVNTEGDYSPDNCRWADKLTQVENTRSGAKVFMVNLGHGEVTVISVCRKLGVDDSNVKRWIKKGAHPAVAILSAWFRKRHYDACQGSGGYAHCEQQARDWLASRGVVF